MTDNQKAMHIEIIGLIMSQTEVIHPCISVSRGGTECVDFNTGEVLFSAAIGQSFRSAFEQWCISTHGIVPF